MARLDRLEPVKEIAQIASVIGRSFDHRTIAALASHPEDELSEAMGRLVEAELVFRRGAPPDATYLFKHALVRDAAYESLLKTKRITLHARLLEVLEANGGTAPEIKAQHAEAAGLTERALDYSCPLPCDTQCPSLGVSARSARIPHHAKTPKIVDF
jgi:predicted ATPase